MADLGAIAFNGHAAYDREITSWPYDLPHRLNPPYARTKSLSGSVYEGSTPVFGAAVFIFLRWSMQCIAKTWTDKNGDWQVDGLVPDFATDYLILIQDKYGGTQYNDAAYSKVEAV